MMIFLDITKSIRLDNDSSDDPGDIRDNIDKNKINNRALFGKNRTSFGEPNLIIAIIISSFEIDFYQTFHNSKSKLMPIHFNPST